MTPPPITHIGVLVADLDTSRDRWASVLGSVFSPVTRYRCPAWRDLKGPNPHLHDARLSFWLADNPSIELLEFVGDGTHSPSRGEGGHHIAWPPVPDNDARRLELERLGVRIDGDNIQNGRSILMFGDARASNNVYTEWVEDGHEHPDVKDDGSPVNRLPDGSKTLFDVETITNIHGKRPDSFITEVGINVTDLDQAVHAWTQITGYTFQQTETETTTQGRFVPPTHSGMSTMSALSSHGKPRIRLIETDRNGIREGLAYAIVSVDNLDAVLTRLHHHEIPFTTERDAGGGPISIDVNPSYLNDFSLRFATPRRSDDHPT